MPTRPTDAASTAWSDPLPDFEPGVLAALPMVADGSMPGFALEMLAMFETTSAGALAAIDAALAAGDRATLLRNVHSLKSASAQIGALALSALAGHCEQLLRSGGDAAAEWSAALRQSHDRALVSLRAARGRFAPPGRSA